MNSRNTSFPSFSPVADCKKRKTVTTVTPRTVVSSLDEIYQKSHMSGLAGTFFRGIKTASDFLHEHFGTTPFQSVILAILAEKYDDRVTTEDIARHLGISNLKLMHYKAEIEQMRKPMNIIEYNYGSHSGKTYAICSEVLSAISDNKVYAPRPFSALKPQEVLKKISKWLDFCDNCEDAYPDMIANIHELIAETQHLQFSRLLTEYGLRDANLAMLLICCAKQVRKHRPLIASYDYEDILDAEGCCNEVCKALNDGTSELCRLGLMENYCEGNQKMDDSFRLTDKAAETLLKEFNYSTNKENATPTDCNILNPEEVVPKELFYNDATQRQVERLEELLSPKFFEQVQARLHEKGLRQGFNVLLYGVAGSGKTELVNQLCRKTGHSVMRVDISKMKTCWYGESQKLVQKTFDRYNQLVKESKECPILVLEECDAILSNRSEVNRGSGDQTDRAIQDICLRNLESHDGIIICTSNLPNALDSAYERRFLFSMEFEKPTPEVRKKIWLSMLPDLAEKDAEALARKYEFTGGNLENIVRRYTVEYVLYGHELSLEALDRICAEEGYRNKKQGSHIGFC